MKYSSWLSRRQHVRFGSANRLEIVYNTLLHLRSIWEASKKPPINAPSASKMSNIAILHVDFQRENSLTVTKSHTTNFFSSAKFLQKPRNVVGKRFVSQKCAYLRLKTFRSSQNSIYVPFA